MSSPFDDDDFNFEMAPLPSGIAKLQPRSRSPRDQAQYSRWLPPDESVPDILAQSTPCDGSHSYLDHVGAWPKQGYVFNGDTIAGVACNGCYLDVLFDAEGNAANVVVKVLAADGATYEDLFLPTKPLAGCYSRMGKPVSGIITVSDYASGLALYASTDACVFVAFFDRNVGAVCAAGMELYGPMPLILAAGGRRAAEMGAIKQIFVGVAVQYGARIAVPSGAPDFRTLLTQQGVAAVVDAVDGAEEVSQRWTDMPEAEPIVTPIAWPARVHPGGLMSRMCAHIARYSALRFESIMTIVLWTLTTHLAEHFAIAPILALQSLTRRCGKTSTLAAIEPLVFYPEVASDITAAGLYRACNQRPRPTLMIDEADQFINRAGHPIVVVINAGHSRAASKVKRVIGGKLVSFDAFGPKLISAIGELPTTIADRSIIVTLLRKHRHDTVEKYVPADNDEATALRAQIEAFVMDHAEAAKRAKPAMPDLPNDRAVDNWRPLFAVASCAGPQWLENARVAAIALTQSDEDVPSVMEELIRDLSTIYYARAVSFISSADLVDALCKDAARPWATFTNGRRIGFHDLGSLMRRLKLSPVQKQVRKGENVKGYMLAELTDLFTRYAAA